MYCIKCGVELADSEKVCPLCGLKVYHPDIPAPQKIDYPYPKFERSSETVSRFGFMFVVTMIFVVPILLSLICDLSINHQVTWSGYVIGGMLLFYIFSVLPSWFRTPNPVIFVPVSFAAIILFLLYVDVTNHGGWFLTFALPTVAGFAAIVTTVVTLMKYVRRGTLFIIGGAVIALGAHMVLMDFLINLTFNTGRHIFWSLIPLIV